MQPVPWPFSAFRIFVEYSSQDSGNGSSKRLEGGVAWNLSMLGALLGFLYKGDGVVPPHGPVFVLGVLLYLMNLLIAFILYAWLDDYNQLLWHYQLVSSDQHPVLGSVISGSDARIGNKKITLLFPYYLHFKLPRNSSHARKKDLPQARQGFQSPLGRTNANQTSCRCGLTNLVTSSLLAMYQPWRMI